MSQDTKDDNHHGHEMVMARDVESSVQIKQTIIMPTLNKKPEAWMEKKKREIESTEDESAPPKRKRARKKCCVEGCNNQVKRAGVCTRHGANRQPQGGRQKINVCTNNDNDTAQTKKKKVASANVGSSSSFTQKCLPKKLTKNIKYGYGDSDSSSANAKARKNPSGTVVPVQQPNSTTGKGEKSVKDEKTTKNSYQQTSPTWEEMLYKLILFQADNNGSTIIPHGDEQNKDLAKWVTNERLLYRQTLRGRVLNPEEAKRTKTLRQIGFLFEGRTHPPISERNKEAWMKRYQELVEYGRINGNFNPPSSKETKNINPAASIGAWCSSQRLAYKEYKALLKVLAIKYPNHPPLNPEDIASIKGTKDPKESGLSLFISKERIDKLHALEGFIWEFRASNTPFDHRIEEYKGFQQKEGHGLVPQHYKDNRALGKWVARQRCEYKALREGKASTLTPEKLAQLEAVNFEFCYGHARGIKSKKYFQDSREKNDESLVR
ncbi:hypothetical protein ACHAWT_008024 [Skeletonema menzelii]